MRRFFAHSISVARSPAGRNLYGAGSEFAIWRSASAFDGRILPTDCGAKCRSCLSAAEWKVDARTPAAPSAASRSFSSPAALSLNVTAMICAGANAAPATCCAIRRVIVVVFPVPAPARMHTGPRTASAARRCSGFSPSRGSTRAPYPRLRRDSVPLVQRVLEHRLAARSDRLCDHRAELGDERQGVTFVDEALEPGEGLLEPRGVDLGPRGAHDLRVRGRADGLALVPEHLVQLLTGARAREDDRDVL